MTSDQTTDEYGRRNADTVAIVALRDEEARGLRYAAEKRSKGRATEEHEWIAYARRMADIAAAIEGGNL